MADALDKAIFFALGCTELIVAVDHKPLLKILGDRSLKDICNGRLRNLKERTLRYRFRVVHIPGIRNRVVDAVSRNPTGEKEPPMLHLPNDVACTRDPQVTRHNFMAGIRTPQVNQKDPKKRTRPGMAAISPLATLHCVTWDLAREAIASDEDMHLLLTLIEDGVPQSHHELPPLLRPYCQYCEHLHSTDGVILYKSRVVIPPCLHQEVLSMLHSARQGTTSMIARAESSVFWPGITSAINQTRTVSCQLSTLLGSKTRSAHIPTSETKLYES